MSRAYVCDRCGKIQDDPMSSVWLVNPMMFTCDDTPRGLSIELCAECYAKFKDEYLANLKECS